MMNNRQKILSSAVIMACSAMSSQAQAALASGAILKFTDGVKVCAISGTYPDCLYGATTTNGSYFSMDNNGNGKTSDDERIPLELNAGLVIGAAQTTSGQSHSGAPDGTETTGIDKAWQFFSNTGMHNSTTAVTSASDDGAGNVTLDMGGWRVDWNSIEDIDMGGDAANFSGDTGIATLTCYSDSAFTAGNETDCLNGTYFKLSYAVHVPVGDASGFGGVPYGLYMEGTVFIVAPAFIAGSTSSFNDGDFGGTAATSYRATTALAEDTGYTQVGSTFDFKFNCGGAGCSDSVILDLGIVLPANAIYRKYSTASGWTSFTENATNTLKSAAYSSGSCPTAASSYSSGLTEGDKCLLLTMVDGGANDADGAADSVVTDPGVIATQNASAVADTRTSSTSGCSMSETPVKPSERADWWLVAGFLGALGWLRLYRRRSNQV